MKGKRLPKYSFDTRPIVKKPLTEGVTDKIE